MADQANGETIRQVLAGFNTMQQQLGLLPVQSSQTPMGVGFQPPPPPPQMPHPSQAAMEAVAQQRDMMQQTMQAAQMTRYIPPPSTPIYGGGGFGGGGGGFSPMNPYMAGALSGNMGGMASPMTMTSHAFGMYRQNGTFASPHVGQGPIPPIFNPFAPTVQPSHFMSPAMQNYQIMQGVQSRNAGLAAGAIDGAARFGSMALGTLAGGFLGGVAGHAVGGFVSDMMLGPGRADMARGRQIQNMTAPWMVSGGMLNPYTGQGMDRESGQATAMGLRKMATRDYDFQKTGFNTEDVMRITQMSSDQGLLTASRSPEDIVRRVKEISKAVKVLTQITGDPDIRNTLAALGQMKDLGFVGTAGQAGAIANRAAFARMAGVSQAGMNDMYGMPGAMMAQQSGLVGATGYMAGMAGGAAANIARSAGALNEMQLARAGGVQGLGQINTMAQLSSLNQDVYMAAALKRGAKGIDIDIDAYRRAQGMSISEVSNAAANNLREMGKEGIFELRTRKQEFKDKLAQQMSPFEMQSNVYRQALGLQRSVPGMNFGSALFSTLQSGGMGDDQAESAARSLELQGSNRDTWNGEIQQRQIQRRQLAAQEKAKWGRFRTPGALTRVGRGIDSIGFGISDTLSSPFRSLSRRMDRAAEDEAAGDRGERIMRFDSFALSETQQERDAVYNVLRGNDAFRGAAEGSQLEEGHWSRTGNRITSTLGLSSTSNTNRMVALSNRLTHSTPFGLHPFASWGNAKDAKRALESAAEMGAAALSAEGMTDAKRADIMDKLGRGLPGKNVSQIIYQASSKLEAQAPRAGLIMSATAMSGGQASRALMQTLAEHGVVGQEAKDWVAQNKELAMPLMAKGVMAWGDKKANETLGLAVDAEGGMGALSAASSRKKIDAEVGRRAKAAGLSDNPDWMIEAGMTGVSYSADTLSQLKKVVGKTDAKTLAMAAALARRNKSLSFDPNKDAAVNALYEKYGAKEADRAMAGAEKLLSSSIPGMKGVLADIGFSGGDLTAKAGALGAFFDVEGAQASHALGMQRLADASGDKNVANLDPMEALKRLGSDDKIMGNAKLGTKAQRAMLIKARDSGDQDALARWMADTGPTETKTILGGGEGGALAEFDERTAEMADLRDQVMASTNDPAMLAFVDGSTMLASAARDLKEATENMKIAQNTPWYQSLLGGGH